MIGEKLKQLRDEKGNSRRDLAKAIKVSTKSVKNWEDDVSNPDLSHLIGIADYYNITLDELVGRDPGDYVMLGKLRETDKRRLRVMIQAYTADAEDESDS